MTGPEVDGRPASAWLAAVRESERRGELLAAYDIAERGLERYPDDVPLKHRAVLALARAGATEQAQKRFLDYGLADVADEDVAALNARIAKDRALAVNGAERRRRAAEAASLYEAIFTRTGGYYPGINAATMYLIAGEPSLAETLARRVRPLALAASGEPYYRAATLAEAALLLDDPAAAREALASAATLHGGDFAGVASTRKQLRLICAAKGSDPTLLASLWVPSVIHYSGHRIAAPGLSGRFAADAESDAAAKIAEALAAERVGFGYGSLACGADILFAEALIARRAELHVVLPFADEEFVATSVATAGPGWVERFRTCIGAAASVSHATEGAHLGDDLLYRYAAEYAMGLALLRARYLDAEIRQIAVWDGGPAAGDAGTAIDVATWKGKGLPLTVIAPRPTSARPSSATSTAAASGAIVGGGRHLRAMLFGDVKGFSKLKDEEIPIFVARLLGTIGEVLARYGSAVLFRNTWGDGIFAVFSDAQTAAACALELQAAIGRLDLVALGLPPSLALRLGGHYGPVYGVPDPVLGVANFFGAHVSRTARIEPVTPEGSVYVSEPFAAALALEGNKRFGCDYVGQMAAAKGYGSFRMYLVRHLGNS